MDRREFHGIWHEEPSHVGWSGFVWFGSQEVHVNWHWFPQWNLQLLYVQSVKVVVPRQSKGPLEFEHSLHKWRNKDFHGIR